MKKSILFLLTIFIIATTAHAQNYGWKDISANLPGTPNLSDVFFVSDNEGWITSSSQAEIYHTSDGGVSFEVQTTQYTCNAIHMLNANEGFAGGASGRVYRTTDDGINWIAIGSIGATLADISFPPVGDTGYCCGINGTIGKITSGGVTQMNSGVPDTQTGISFPISSEEGWVCGGSIIMTYFNGVWGGLPNDYPSGGYNAIYMVDSLNGWVVGDGGIIAHTIDGQNWFEQENQQENSLFDVYFLDLNNGWATGSGGTIVHTNNGGGNWIVVGAGITSHGLTGVHFTSTTNGYVVGNGKTLLKFTEISGIGDEVEHIKFEIYPNPAQNKIQIQCSEFNTESGIIEIQSLDGKKILEKEIDTGIENIELDLNNLETGMYLCKITIDKKSTTKKLIIE